MAGGGRLGRIFGAVRSAAAGLLLAAALAAALAWAAAAAPAPQRIVSLNLCIDQLLIDLVARERIASVTHLAHDPLYSPRAADFAGIPANHGLAEEVLALEPDLVLTGPFSRPSTTALLRRLGYRVVEVPVAATLAEVRSQIRELAALVGAEARGAAMIADMDRRLAALPPRRDPAPDALIYATNGLTGGAGTLADEVRAFAGIDNTARALGIEGWRLLDLETLVVGRPDFLVVGDLAAIPPSLGRQLLRHPALARPGLRRIELSSSHWVCAGPAVLAAVESLADARLAATAEPSR